VSTPTLGTWSRGCQDASVGELRQLKAIVEDTRTIRIRSQRVIDFIVRLGLPELHSRSCAQTTVQRSSCRRSETGSTAGVLATSASMGITWTFGNAVIDRQDRRWP
jgi:hypothetical protein